MKAHEILNQANAEMQDRAKTYDRPAGERSMGACINAFEAITNVKITVEQGWLFMCLLKAVRSQQGEYRADNYVDLAAYAGLMGEAASDPDYRDRRLNGLRAMKDQAKYLPKHGLPVSPFEHRSADVTPEEDEAWDEAKNQEFAEQWDEKRIDVIGQNGPTGEHYDAVETKFGNHRIDKRGLCVVCGEKWRIGDRITTECQGKPCDHTAGLHSYSSTKEAQCIDCKEMLVGGDDAKLTQHKRKSGVGPDT